MQHGRSVMVLAAMVCALAASAPAHAAPAPTGRWLVSFKQESTARSSAALSAVLARAGVRRAGRGVPRLGIATVRGSAGALRALRRDPRVDAVGREWYRELRAVPNDPALRTREDEYGGIPRDGPIQWALAREGFYGAWDVARGDGARVAVLDIGIDAGHPEFAGKVDSADVVGGNADPRSDRDGHGTHTAGLACAATNNGVGIAGAGYNCHLRIIKFVTTPTGGIRDEDIVDAIRLAADRGADAISMSFGGGGTNAVLDRAIDYAVGRGAVLVAAASNDNVGDQGAPASQLQPGDAANINAGRGLVVTAAEYTDGRAGTGWGPQVSLAAYGFFDDGVEGPPGLISTFPGSSSSDIGCELLIFVCVRRNLGGDDRYAYLQGTSMAVPQVAGLAALIGRLNPFLTVQEKLRMIKETARGSAWGPELGWGIINAGAAVDAARRVDRRAPRSRARSRKRVRVKQGRKRRRVRVRWSGRDRPGNAGLIPAGIRNFDLYMRKNKGRYKRIRKRTTKHSARLRLKPGVYRFYTRARDKAGNREAKPTKADARLVVKKPKG